MEKTTQNHLVQSPRVSVIMPVYNTEKFVKRAIDSILGQTFQDLELIVVDDGSTDRSREIIGSYASDPRVRIVFNETNLGESGARNRAIPLAQGEFIAMMDSDDYSMPERLRKQVAFLDAHPEISFCGTWYDVVDEQGKLLRHWTAPADHPTIMASFFFANRIGHNTIMMRRKEFMDAGEWYTPGHHAADFDLWVRLIRKMRFANIPEPCVLWTVWSGQMSIEKFDRQTADAIKALRYHFEASGITPTDEEMDMHGGVVVRGDEIHFNARQATVYTQLLRKINRCEMPPDSLDRRYMNRWLVRMYRVAWREVKPKIRLKIDKRIFALSLWWARR